MVWSKLSRNMALCNGLEEAIEEYDSVNQFGDLDLENVFEKWFGEQNLGKWLGGTEPSKMNLYNSLEDTIKEMSWKNSFENRILKNICRELFDGKVLRKQFWVIFYQKRSRKIIF